MSIVKHSKFQALFLGYCVDRRKLKIVVVKIKIAH